MRQRQAPEVPVRRSVATLERPTTTRIEFIRGIRESCVPEVKLTRSRDGSNGTAMFRFRDPDLFREVDPQLGEVTGMYLIDEEGVLLTRDVKARFVDNVPNAIEATYVMQGPDGWSRFMRFMERFAEENNLTFTKANAS